MKVYSAFSTKAFLEFLTACIDTNSPLSISVRSIRYLHGTRYLAAPENHESRNYISGALSPTTRRHFPFSRLRHKFHFDSIHLDIVKGLENHDGFVRS